MADQLSADCRPTVDRQSADRFFGELFFTITELFYNNPLNSIVNMYWVGLVNYMRSKPNWSFTHAVGFMYSL